MCNLNCIWGVCLRRFEAFFLSPIELNWCLLLNPNGATHTRESDFTLSLSPIASCTTSNTRSLFTRFTQQTYTVSRGFVASAWFSSSHSSLFWLALITTAIRAVEPEEAENKEREMVIKTRNLCLTLTKTNFTLAVNRTTSISTQLSTV